MAVKRNVIRALFEMVERPTTSPEERDAARRALQRLVDRYGAGILAGQSVEGIDTHEVLVEVRLAYSHKWEKELAQHVGWFLGGQVFVVQKNERTVKQVLLKVDETLSEYAEELYRYHRKIVRKHINSFVLGYRWEAMPYEVDESVPVKQVSLPEQFRQSMRHGATTGSQNRSSPQNQPKLEG